MLLAGGLTGCSTMADGKGVPLVQQLLDAIVPPGFEGDFDSSENVPVYVNFTLQARGLKRTPQGWVFTYFRYDRNGPVGTTAHIELGKRP